jgi:hypothetical protein
VIFFSDLKFSRTDKIDFLLKNYCFPAEVFKSLFRTLADTNLLLFSPASRGCN